MEDRFRQQIKKGVLDMVVLGLVAEKPTYGYEILQELERRGCGFFQLKEGTLYPVLYRLVNDGCITGTDRIEGRRMRVYYHLEPKGEEVLKTLCDKYQSWVSAIKKLM